MDKTLLYVSVGAMVLGGGILGYDWIYTAQLQQMRGEEVEEQEMRGEEEQERRGEELDVLELRLKSLQSKPSLPQLDDSLLKKWEMEEEEEKRKNLVRHLDDKIKTAPEGADTSQLQHMREEEVQERLERERKRKRVRELVREVERFQEQVRLEMVREEEEEQEYMQERLREILRKKRQAG